MNPVDFWNSIEVTGKMTYSMKCRVFADWIEDQGELLEHGIFRWMARYYRRKADISEVKIGAHNV